MTEDLPLQMMKWKRKSLRSIPVVLSYDAKQESINTILEMAEHKKDGKCKILIVTGCLAHRYQDEITKKSRKSMHLSEHLPMIKLQMLLKPF